MNGRAYYSGPVAGVAGKDKEDFSDASYEREDGEHTSRAPRINGYEPEVGDSTGDDAARIRDARDEAKRTCRNIIARYDWVRLEESLFECIQGEPPLPDATRNRAVFEGHEPANGFVELFV